MKAITALSATVKIAVINADFKTVKLLLKHNAVFDDDVIQIAINNKYFDIVKLLNDQKLHTS